MKPPYPSPTPTWHNTSYPAIHPTNPILSLASKTCIITGGGRGLGAEIARAYAAAGASHLALIGRTQRTLSETASKLKAEFSSVEVSTHVGDVTDEEAMRKAAEGVGRKWDVLVLNAGVLAAEAQVVGTLKVAEWWGVFETNVKGALTTTQAFLPHRSPTASLIGINANMISLPAASPTLHGTSAYVCSKIAQMKLLEYVAAEATDLFVASVHPGVLMTDMLKEWGSVKHLNAAMLDDLTLPAHFLVWVVSPSARFLRGKYVCANWDVDELKAQAGTIAGGRGLENGILGWPYGDGALDAMLAAPAGSKDPGAPATHNDISAQVSKGSKDPGAPAMHNDISAQVSKGILSKEGALAAHAALYNVVAPR